MKIAIDLDDTLSTPDRMGRALGYIARKGLQFQLIDPDSHELVKMFDWTEEDAIRFVNEGGIAVYTEAEARKGAREVLARWRKEGHTIVILTARPKTWFQNPSRLTRDWLEKRRIPFDEIVADCSEKGKYCIEHGISVLIDDNVDTCVSAQSMGVTAILASGKHSGKRNKEVAFSGSDWNKIDKCFRDMQIIPMYRKLFERARPARKEETYDGWLMRLDRSGLRRANCVLPVGKSTKPLDEKIVLCEERYHAEGKPCRFLLTPFDRELDAVLRGKGYLVERILGVYEIEKLPHIYSSEAIKVTRSPEEWEGDYTAVSGQTEFEDYTLSKGDSLYITVFSGGAPAAVACGVLDGDLVGVYDVFTRPDLRRKGLARAALGRLFEEAEALGAKRGYLRTYSSDAASTGLFESLGFYRVYDCYYLTK